MHKRHANAFLDAYVQQSSKDVLLHFRVASNSISQPGSLTLEGAFYQALSTSSHEAAGLVLNLGCLQSIYYSAELCTQHCVASNGKLHFSSYT